MKLRLLSFSLCAMLLSAGALFTGCTNTTTPGTATQGYFDTYADMTGLSPGTTYVFNISGGASGSAITGVSAYQTGTVRVFWNRASGDSSQITPTATAGITGTGIVWAAVVGSSTIRLYETADLNSNEPSGLVLGGASGTHAASISGAEKANIDLVLLTDPTISLPQITLISAKDGIMGGANTRDALFGFTTPTTYFKGGLAAQMFSSGTLSTIIGNNNFFDITPLHFDSSSAVIIVKTQDNNYARVEIVPQANVTTFQSVSGHLLWGDTGGSPSYRFIDVKVTYNTTVNSPYAMVFNRKNKQLAYAGD